MEPTPSPVPHPVAITVRLLPEDIEILEKYRGEMSADSFITALLRMIASGAVQGTPEWVKTGKKTS